MSRGPGIRQRHIEQAFAPEFEDVFTVDDLARIAFPGITRVEKKHRVAAIRAAAGACERTGYSWYCRQAPGHENIYFNKRSVRSYAIARCRADFVWNNLPTDTIRERLDWPLGDTRFQTVSSSMENPRMLMVPGREWHSHVELWKAELDACTDAEKAAAAEAKNRYIAENDAKVRALLGASL